MAFDHDLGTPFQRRMNPFHVALVLILLLRVVLGLWYMAWLPPFQNPDELGHYDVVRFIAREGRLPTMTDAPLPHDMHIFVQYDQPPLYYLFLAPIVRALGGTDSTYPIANPPTFGAQIYQSYFLYPIPLATAPLWATRIINLTIATATIVVMFAAVRVQYPESPFFALFVALLMALYPPLLILTAWLNNDLPLLLVGALVLWLIAKIRTQEKSRWAWAGLFALMLLALGIKLTAIVLLPFVALMIGTTVPRQWRIGFLGAIGATFIAWIAYNLQRCGQILCRIHRTPEHMDTWPEFIALFRADTFRTGLRHLINTLALQTVNDAIVPPMLLYIIAWATLIIGALGVVWMLRREWQPLWPSLVLIGLALMLALLRVWYLAVGYMPLRYLMIAVPALVLLLAHGYAQWRVWGVGGVWVVWSALALITPFYVLQPIQETVQVSAAPLLTSIPLDCTIADVLTIQAYSVHEDTLSLTMTKNRHTNRQLYTLVTIYNDDQLIVYSGRITGTFAYPFPQWEVGESVSFSLSIGQIPTDADARIQQYLVDTDHYLSSTVDIDDPLNEACNLTLR